MIYQANYKLCDYNTVFQAELRAIERSAIFFNQSGYCGYIKFYVDSQSAITALNQNLMEDKMVAKCIRSLNKLGKNVK